MLYKAWELNILVCGGPEQRGDCIPLLKNHCLAAVNIKCTGTQGQNQQGH